eukprot:TRINITY_DN9813_c0_g1_i1.p1 TRINITY_DN9813_c0_g1~~TRINITY_DN9813_c0_g1_i1.p1  ORF type:complete len:316 (-),score=41.61 TRINITY_DN9813_c0_g1_i1:313-1260(-)
MPASADTWGEPFLFPPLSSPPWQNEEPRAAVRDNDRRREGDSAEKSENLEELAGLANVAQGGKENRSEGNEAEPSLVADDASSSILPFDLIVASDILLYVSQYPALVRTLSALLRRMRSHLGTERGRSTLIENGAEARQTHSRPPKEGVLIPDGAPGVLGGGGTEREAIMEKPDFFGRGSLVGTGMDDTGTAQQRLTHEEALLEAPLPDSSSLGSLGETDVAGDRDRQIGKQRERQGSKGNSRRHMGRNGRDGSGRLLPSPAFLMSWRRRLPKEYFQAFCEGCNEAGLEVEDWGSRVYCIYFPSSSHSNLTALAS